MLTCGHLPYLRLMKPHRLRKALLLPAVLLSLSLTSCVDPTFGGGFSTNPGYANRYNSYATLPQGYSGSAYLYNNRYYSGGQYQTGSYNYQGRQYTNRYYHNGQYYYGGQHQNHSGSHQPQRYSGRVQDNHSRSNHQGSSSSYNRSHSGSR